MEDVLAVYTRPRDPDRPLVCLDETSKQLIAETRVPIPMKPGRRARCDYEYARNGTANLFMMFAPLEGWRHVGHGPPTAVDYAHVLKDLADTTRHRQGHCPGPGQPQYPQQSFTLRGVPGRASPAAGGALRMALTPKHGSWLDLASPNLAFYRLNASIAASPTNKPSSRNCRLGARPKCKPHQGRLALHNRRRTHQIQTPVPVNLIEGPSPPACTRSLHSGAL